MSAVSRETLRARTALALALRQVSNQGCLYGRTVTSTGGPPSIHRVIHSVIHCPGARVTTLMVPPLGQRKEQHPPPQGDQCTSDPLVIIKAMTLSKSPRHRPLYSTRQGVSRFSRYDFPSHSVLARDGPGDCHLERWRGTRKSDSCLFPPAGDGRLA